MTTKTKRSAKTKHVLRDNVLRFDLFTGSNIAGGTKRKRNGVPGAFGNRRRDHILMLRQGVRDQIEACERKIETCVAYGQAPRPTIIAKLEKLKAFLTNLK